MRKQKTCQTLAQGTLGRQCVVRCGAGLAVPPPSGTWPRAGGTVMADLALTFRKPSRAGLSEAPCPCSAESQEVSLAWSHCSVTLGWVES